MRSPSRLRIGAAGLVTALLATVLGTAVLAAPASAAPPVYVVAGDDPLITGSDWGLHDGAPSGGFYSELRSIITGGSFGSSGATFTIGAPRTLPLTAGSLNGIDVYFLSARNLEDSEIPHLNAFVARGGAVIANSNAPGFFDTTAWAGFTLSDRVVFGDGPAPYTTYRAPSPSAVIAAQANHPIMNRPGSVVTAFDNWHSVAGFSATPPGAVALARTTLTGPANDSGTASNITITNVTTLAAIPANTSTGSGPIVATSDVDTFANAYRDSDATNNLTTATGNGRLARNTFAWIADQLTVLHPPTATSGFVPLTTPVRALDSRNTGGAFRAGEARQVSLAATGVPADAELVAINLTAVNPGADGYLTAWPTGIARPGVSSVNFTRGVTIANAALVAVGTGNTISIYNFGGSADVVVDVSGYVAPSRGARLVNLTPTRLKDTRTGLGGSGIANAGTTQSLRIAGAGGVPANASAVVLNVTAVDPNAGSYVTVWPDGEGRPLASNINTTPGVTLPNLVVARIPASGNINLYNHSGSTHLVVDVFGYYVSDNPTTGRISPLSPDRVIDTRAGIGGGVLRQGEERTFNLGITGASAVIVNVTVAEPTANGFLTVYPTDVTRPQASNLNFLAGRSVPNLVVVRPSANGQIRVFNNSGDTHVLVDVIARVDA